jgi:Tol biopolymer transport system component
MRKQAHHFSLVWLILIVLAFPLSPGCIALGRAELDVYKIAFVAYPLSQPTRLMTINPDGSDLQQVAEAARIFDIAWSPDRRYLRYDVLMEDFGRGDNFITDRKGSFTSTIKGVSQIAWSPDSQHLAYIAGKAKQAALYLAKGDGSAPMPLLDMSKAVSGFAWNADSQSLFIGLNGSLYLLVLKDKRLERLAVHTLAPVNLALSPDGKQLSYFVGNSLYLLASSTHKTRQVGTMPVDPEYGWAPDSGHVFFAVFVKGDQQVLYLMNGDGSNLRRVGEASPCCVRFTWTPDGKHVWYDALSVPGKSLESATGKIVGGNFVATVAWSPDGKQAVFSSRVPKNSLQLADPTFTTFRPIPETENLGELGRVAW